MRILQTQNIVWYSIIRALIGSVKCIKKLTNATLFNGYRMIAQWSQPLSATHTSGIEKCHFKYNILLVKICSWI